MPATRVGGDWLSPVAILDKHHHHGTSSSWSIAVLFWQNWVSLTPLIEHGTSNRCGRHGDVVLRQDRSRWLLLTSNPRVCLSQLDLLVWIHLFWLFVAGYRVCLSFSSRKCQKPAESGGRQCLWSPVASPLVDSILSVAQ